MLAFFRFLSHLPLPLLQAAGALVGLLAYVLSGAYRRKLRVNLAQAGLPPGLRLACALEAGRLLGELPWVWFRPLAQVVGKIRCDDVAVLEEAERSGRGVLFLTPHLGAFDVAGRFYAARRPITAMYKPPKQASLARVISAARSLPQMHSVPAALAGVRALLRALRRGEAVGVLPDQVPGNGDGRWEPFFGRLAYTMTLPQRLAHASDAVVVMAVGERLENGTGWHLHLRRLDAEPTPAMLNAEMEREIRRFPVQYLWGYNRYKVPAGVAPPGTQASDRGASRQEPDGGVPPVAPPQAGAR